jgi:hypothetical protein
MKKVGNPTLGITVNEMSMDFKPGKMTFGISLVISGGNSFRSNTGTDKGLSLSALK